MTLRRVTPLAGNTILPLADAKAQCRVLHSDDDAEIGRFRDAAVAYVETQTGIILAPGSFVWAGTGFPVELPIGPVDAITSVEYRGTDGALTLYEGAVLQHGFLRPAGGQTWPAVFGSVTIVFTAGVTDPATMPDLLSAVRIKTQELYDRAHGSDQVEHYARAVEALIAPHRQVLV